MVGTVTTSLTLIYGMQHIDAIATVILLQLEPVYSLILSVIVVGERPSPRQLLATSAILAGIGSVFWAGNSFTPMFAAVLIFREKTAHDETCTPDTCAAMHVDHAPSRQGVTQAG